jgi:hypothetical protein
MRNDPNDVPHTFGRLDLRNYFYALPLGWALSEKTQDIISLDSGRFWDCHPGSGLTQSDAILSKADCEIMQVYYLLNHSVKDALSEFDTHESARRYLLPIIGPNRTASAKTEVILACYEREWIQRRARQVYERRASKTPHRDTAPPYRQRYLAGFQSEYARALLTEWERQGEKNRDAMAYFLGSISYDSEDFSRTTEDLSFKRPKRVGAIGAARNRTERAAVVHSSPYLPEPVHEALRKIAFEERLKIHDVVLEGIDAALRRRGYPSIENLKAGTKR